MSNVEQVCILQKSEDLALLQEYSNRFQLPLVQESALDHYLFHLKFDRSGLGLFQSNAPRTRAIRMHIGNLRPMSRKSIFGHALGKADRLVLDATAGLGGDALLMARMGYRVIAVEQIPAVAALLYDGVSKVNSQLNQLSIEMMFDNSLDLLRRNEVKPDVIYLDPMYPKGRKPNVKVSRRLEVLRQLAGDEQDTNELLEESIRVCETRVVIKRPTFAETIFPERLSNSFKGKLVRYDVYSAVSN